VMTEAEVLRRFRISEASKVQWADPVIRARRLAGLKRRREQRALELTRLLDGYVADRVAEVLADA